LEKYILGKYYTKNNNQENITQENNSGPSGGSGLKLPLSETSSKNILIHFSIAPQKKLGFKILFLNVTM